MVLLMDSNWTSSQIDMFHEEIEYGRKKMQNWELLNEDK